MNFNFFWGMKRYLAITLLLISVFSCMRENHDFISEELLSAEAEVRFSLSSSNEMETKSQYNVSDLKMIHNIWVMAIADDGYWRAKFYTESDFIRNGASVTFPAMSFLMLPLCWK